MTYRESIDWLFSTQMFGIKLGLDGPSRLLKKFLAFPRHDTRVIHVAGTNGKGSVCAMIDSVARAAGIRSGLFTSPHLVDFRERITVFGAEISEEQTALGLTELRTLCESLDPHPTFFEITLALAMRHFRDKECEMIVLETGMGGRLDATTAVPADVCVITPIALDHQEWLGESLAQIAFEKAGILVEGKPAISSAQPDDARRVLREQANEVRCPLEFIENPLVGYPIGLPGPHQADNAALALTALHAAGVRLAYDVVQYGLSSISWPGRFEIIPRPASGNDDPNHLAPIVLDGAHNPAAAEALTATWRQRFRKKKCTLVFSSVAGKDLQGILELLAPLAERIHFCPIASPRGLQPDELSAAAGDMAPQLCFPGVKAALDAALEHPQPILVAGSLFLVGEVRSHLLGSEHLPTAQ